MAIEFNQEHGTAYRFTETDETAIRRALGPLCDPFRSGPRYPRHVLIAQAARVLHCTSFDLRDVELQWIANEIGELELGL